MLHRGFLGKGPSPSPRGEGSDEEEDDEKEEEEATEKTTAGGDKAPGPGETPVDATAEVLKVLHGGSLGRGPSPSPRGEGGRRKTEEGEEEEGEEGEDDDVEGGIDRCHCSPTVPWEGRKPPARQRTQ